MTILSTVARQLLLAENVHVAGDKLMVLDHSVVAQVFHSFTIQRFARHFICYGINTTRKHSIRNIYAGQKISWCQVYRKTISNFHEIQSWNWCHKIKRIYCQFKVKIIIKGPLHECHLNLSHSQAHFVSRITSS